MSDDLPCRLVASTATDAGVCSTIGSALGTLVNRLLDGHVASDEVLHLYSEVWLIGVVRLKVRAPSRLHRHNLWLLNIFKFAVSTLCPTSAHVSRLNHVLITIFLLRVPMHILALLNSAHLPRGR